jgi:zinc/manganese transport system substrate-binding protein
MADVALALAERLALLEPALGSGARQRAARFAEATRVRVPAWQARARGSGGVVMFHKDGVYLTERLGVPLLGTLEPLPGVPPTAGHLRDLRERLQGKAGVILRHSYQPAQGGDALAKDLGWPARVVELELPAGADATAYYRLIDEWVEALVGRR